MGTSPSWSEPSLHALAWLASALEVTVADLVLGSTPREDLFRITRDWPSVEVLRLRKAALLVQQTLQAEGEGLTPRAPAAPPAYPSTRSKPATLVAEPRKRKK